MSDFKPSDLPGLNLWFKRNAQGVLVDMLATIPDLKVGDDETVVTAPRALPDDECRQIERAMMARHGIVVSD